MPHLKKPHPRVKIVINNNSIEKVSDFQYLEYLTLNYKNYLEDKLQTYNKLNGSIRRHLGKQMTKETELRIHNITS
jgi:short-subunit dehydrogenase involved in D-alanine esterification of teichoic acids